MGNSLACLLWVGVVASSAAAATECPAFEGADSALVRRDSEERIRFLLQRLDAEHGRARLWAELWDGALSVLTVGPLALLPFSGQTLPLSIQLNEKDLTFSAFTSAATIAAVTLLPLPSWREVPRPSGTGCEDLAALEKLALTRSALEHNDHSLWAHIRNLLINGSVATLGLGLGLGRWHSAWIGSITGSAIGEIMLLTKPDRLMDDLQLYRTGAWEAEKQPAPEVAILPNLDARNTGIVLMLRF